MKPGAGAMALLRTGTQDLHSALDQQSVMHLLMSPDLTLPQYAAILRRLHTCLGAIAPTLDSFLHKQTAAVPWLDPRIYQRRADLESDLVALGCGLNPAPDLGAAPGPELLLAPIESMAEAAGVIYVLAGASLGARLIERQLRAQLGSEVNAALCYFSPPADGSIPSWPTMRHWLNDALEDAHDQAVALKAARRAFRLFIAHVSPPLIETCSPVAAL